MGQNLLRSKSGPGTPLPIANLGRTLHTTNMGAGR